MKRMLATRPPAIRLGLAVVAGLTGLALNTLEWPVLTADTPQFVLGGIPVLATYALLGPGYGLLASLLSLSQSFSRLDPAGYATAVYVVEYLVTARIASRLRAFTVASPVYWLLVGLPLDLLVYRGWMGLSGDYVLLVFFKQVLNGSLNAVVAGLVVTAAARPVARLLGSIEPMTVSLRTWSFRLGLSVVVVPVLVASLLVGREAFFHARTQAFDEARRSANRVGTFVNQRLEIHERDVTELARRLDLGVASGTSESEATLQRFLANRPEFINVCETDDQGSITASAPGTTSTGTVFVGQSVANRPYFQNARDSRMAAWGPLIVGTMHVRQPQNGEPILIVAVPLYRADRSFRGVVFAAVDVVAQFGDLLSGRRSSLPTITVLDADDHIVYSDRPARTVGGRIEPPVADFLRRITDAGHLEYAPALEDTLESALGLNRQYAAVQAVRRGGLSALADVPSQWVHARLTSSVVNTLALFFVSFGAALGLVVLAAQRLSERSGEWQQVVEALSSGRRADPAILERHDTSPVAEVRAVARALRDIDANTHAGRVAAAASLADRERRLQSLADHTSSVIFIRDLEGRYLFVNRQFATRRGMPAAAIVGRTDVELFPPDLAVSFRAKEREMLEAGEAREFDVEMPYADGPHHFMAVLFPLRDESGSVCATAGICTDITARQRTEAALRESEERYRTVADYTHDWEYWLTPDGRLAWVSPSCERLTGYSAREFMANPGLLLAITYADDRPVVSEHLAAACGPPVDQGEVALPEREFRIIAKDGTTRWIAHVCRAVVGPDGTYHGRRASNRDVTSRKDAEADRLELLAQNLQLRKAQSLGQMAGAIAHLFNNHLAVIMGNLELAQSRVGPTVTADLIGEAKEAADRAAHVAGLMLTYLGVQVSPHEPTDLAAICQQAADTIKPTVPSGMAIELGVVIPGPVVNADGGQLATALVQLLTNGIEAGGAAGVVRVRVGIVDGETLKVFGYRHPPNWQPRDEPYAYVDVEDAGAGVPPEHLDRVFDPFFSTKFTGRGMGLAVVAGIAAGHDGAVLVQTSPAGSTFRLCLPLAGRGSD